MLHAILVTCLQLVCHVAIAELASWLLRPGKWVISRQAPLWLAEFQLNAHKFKISNNYGDVDKTLPGTQSNANRSDDAAVARIAQRT